MAIQIRNSAGKLKKSAAGQPLERCRTLYFICLSRSITIYRLLQFQDNFLFINFYFVQVRLKSFIPETVGQDSDWRRWSTSQHHSAMNSCFCFSAFLLHYYLQSQGDGISVTNRRAELEEMILGSERKENTLHRESRSEQLRNPVGSPFYVELSEKLKKRLKMLLSRSICSGNVTFSLHFYYYEAINPDFYQQVDC